MADVTALREDLLRWADDVFSEALSMMVEDLREAAPVGEDRMGSDGFHMPGETRNGIEAIPGGSPTHLAGTIISVTPQGEWVEKGTQPHRHAPRRHHVRQVRRPSGPARPPVVRAHRGALRRVPRACRGTGDVMVPGTIRDQLGELLDLAVEALSTYEGAADPPERRYVAHGTVTWDCDQLTTHLVRTRPKLIDSRSAPCAVILVSTYAVTLIRCWPKGDQHSPIPSADELDAAGRQMAVDGEAIFKTLTRAWATGVWPAGVDCKRVEWNQLEPAAPSGGFAAWRLEVSVQHT